ncbi:hypothetical protein WJX73_000714 [Symbiochloris irregularis]
MDFPCSKGFQHNCYSPPLPSVSTGYHRRVIPHRVSPGPKPSQFRRPSAAGVNGRAFVRSSAPQSEDQHPEQQSSLQRGVAEDPWLARTLSSFASLQSSQPSPWLQQLRDSCQQALQTQRMPTTRNEAFRFTDVSPILKSSFQMSTGTDAVSSSQVASHPLPDADGARIVLVNGQFAQHLSDTSQIPEGVFLGEVSDAPEEIASNLGQQARVRGGPFALVNGATAQQVLCLHVPEGTCLDVPVHILHLSTGASGDVSLSSPRTLIKLGPKAMATVVEEFSSPDASAHYFANAVGEIELGQGASLTHR